jgi:hypothetical protein
MAVYIPRPGKSNTDPQPYDKAALRYLKDNESTINLVSSDLGVSPNAVAGSMAREITRSDGEILPEHALHAVLFDLAKLKSEQSYEEEYQKDLQDIARNPGILDGNPWGRYLSYPTVRDIGPGSIKVFTAIQIIKQYQETAQAKALGLDKYKLTDLKAIVHDLNDPANPLSIKIAGLVVLNGQKFFSDKSIAGIPWAKLTKEQQDAALTAYYTVGEHAVSVDMAKNEFFPFAPGPKGGKVGPWILFGNNYSNLNTILAKGRSLGLSVAPVARPKPPRKAQPEYMKHAGTGAMLAPARKVLDLLPVGTNYIANIAAAVEAANVPAAKYMAAAGGLPQSLAPRLWAELPADVNRRGSTYTALAQGQPGSLVSELYLAMKDRTAMALWVAGAAASAPVFSRFSAIERRTLPSISPIGRRARDEVSAEPLVARSAESAMPAAGQYAAPVLPAGQKIDQRRLRGALDELLSRQGRLPPSGGAAFDPLLTPAWPGLQLPV